MSFPWKRVDYLIHRWIGLVLGLLVVVWFASGIVMMYHRYPFLTDSRQLALLSGFELESTVVGFAAAERAYREATAKHAATRESAGNQALPEGSEHEASAEHHQGVNWARLRVWDNRLVYELWKDHGSYPEPLGLVDARTGRLVTPISAETAERAARALVGPLPAVKDVTLLPRSDHYFMGGERKPFFPVYRVQFADSDATAVYVSRDGGVTPAVVTRLTRFTTWFGTVPHWLYMMWLYYDRPGLWLWISLILPGVTVVLALTGIVLGTYQLFPRRRRGEWRMSPYKGVSRWHHVSGIFFGLAVTTWALSGMFEVLGVGNGAQVDQPQLGQGGDVRWGSIRVRENEAWNSLRGVAGDFALPRAIDLMQFDGQPGYHFKLQDGRSFWVDAQTGMPRGELSPAELGSVANRVAGVTAPVAGIEKITKYDTYYYARHGREMSLPAWRVSLADPENSTVYFDTVSGRVTGFVNNETRNWRWWRDALHTFDFAWLNNRRPLWDMVVLPILLGATAAAATGVYLLARRWRRLARA